MRSRSGPLRPLLVLGLGACAALGLTPSSLTAAASATAPGYALATASGAVATFGGAGFSGDLISARGRLTSPVVAMAATADRRGYWLVTRAGTVHAFGDATGGTAHLAGIAPVISAVSDPLTGGYWVLGASGRVLGVDAPSFPRPSGLTGRPVGVALSADGRGVWLASASGQLVSTAPTTLPVPSSARVAAAFDGAPVAALATTPDGGGLWLASATGQVLALGDAPHFGDAAFPSSTVTALIPTPDAQGYLVVARDGSVAAFGDAVDLGNASSPLHPPDYPAFFQLPPTDTVSGAFLGPGPQPARRGGLRVTFLGDSEAAIVAQWTTAYLARHDPGTVVGDGAIQGCGIVGPLELATYSTPGPAKPTLPACGLWQQQDQRTLALTHPDVVVVLLGYWESQQHLLDGALVTPVNSAPYLALLRAHLIELCQLVAASGARLIFLSAPDFGDGTPDVNVAAFNTLESGVARTHHAMVLDLGSLVDPTGTYDARADGFSTRTSDSVHFTKTAVLRLIDPVLAPRVLGVARAERDALRRSVRR